MRSGAPRVAKLLQTPHQTMLSRGGGRIVGGTDATYGEFPHQIALLRGGVGGSFMCGGSLVSNNYVITAGHCCDG
jgi:secreted trypsin-like serine protease